MLLLENRAHRRLLGDDLTKFVFVVHLHDFNESVESLTEMGLLVVQEYPMESTEKQKKKTVKTKSALYNFNLNGALCTIFVLSKLTPSIVEIKMPQ